MSTATRDELIVSNLRLHSALSTIAGYVTTDEGDTDATEDEIGLEIDEVIEMAHDNMIETARRALKDPKVLSL